MDLKASGVTILATAVVAGLAFCSVSADEPEVIQIPSTAESLEEIQESLRNVSKHALMQGKLNASSEILEGLVNGDFQKIKHSANALQAIALTAPRQYSDVEKLASGEHLRREFIRLSQRLSEVAEDRNLEGAAYVHQNITATCIACHLKIRERNAPIKAR